MHYLWSEMIPENHEEVRLFSRWWRWLKALPERLTAKFSEIAVNTKKIAQDDPRTVIHSAKVGFALTLVSLFYYYLLYDSFHPISAMGDVMTVLVVFEFSVAHYLATLSGRICEPILLGFFVFLQAAASTFVRFFPIIKARYDYGLLIFILTFSLTTVSGFRDDEILVIALKRLFTAILGGCVCVIISILVCPVWAGEDLHNLIALNLEELANFLEGFGDEYFKTDDATSTDDKSFLQGYKSVLIQKVVKSPWLILHTGSHVMASSGSATHGNNTLNWNLTRECAYRIDTLSAYLTSDVQASAEFRSKIQEACQKMSLDSSKALKESASAVTKMREPASADPYVSNSKAAAKNLESLLRSGLGKDADLLSVIPAATVASLLIDVVQCTEKIVDSVRELASLAHWDKVEPAVSPENVRLEQSEGADKPHPEIECPHAVITITASPENGYPSAPTTTKQMDV
ncbi:Aluminum-activated malate transporter 2 [Morella rubra]|uniref:Aluminum-activated malate transporter 2 n=1 Tax=Morella rubra TaxID=262757 RepID=A0A6A1VLP8_9ROSI|nr:Aluminum-activated malate transporter 2 [Morella rubra]